MSENTSIPFDDQVVFPEKEEIPELNVVESSPYHQVFGFNGSIYKPTSNLVIGGTKVLNCNVLMKPNCITAISQSNKRYLDDFGLLTDYIAPNQLLFQSLGFTADESKYLMYSKNLDEFPVDVILTGYDVQGTKKKLEEPQVEFVLNNGVRVSKEEATRILADWLLDSDFSTNVWEEIYEGCDNLEDAQGMVEFSEESRAYGELMSPDDAWYALEYACMHSAAEVFIKSMSLAGSVAYTLMQAKYEEGGILLVRAQLAFGLDDECEMHLAGELGTPNTAYLVNKDVFEETGEFECMIESPVLKHFEAVGYDVDSEEDAPELPEEVLDELTDVYWYIAEAVCDDLAFELNM